MGGEVPGGQGGESSLGVVVACPVSGEERRQEDGLRYKVSREGVLPGCGGGLSGLREEREQVD